MKYELDDNDIKNLMEIINKSNITGATAEVVVLLKHKLRSPLVEEKIEGK